MDHTPALASALRDNLRLLKSDRGNVVCQDVESYLRNAHRPPFDIIFMDPPFRQGWLERLLPLIASGPWVKPGSWVYIEHETELAAPQVPPGWHLHRQKTAGQVTYNLYRVAPDTEPE